MFRKACFEVWGGHLTDETAEGFAYVILCVYILEIREIMVSMCCFACERERECELGKKKEKVILHREMMCKI